jgi:prepilin-type N-terminal cleavage/methylation domain-containing protein
LIVNAPLNKKHLANQTGFSMVELVIVAAMLAVVLGFALVSFLRFGRNVQGTSSAMEIASSLQKARLDSMRRSARDVNEMAQVKIFNRRFYSVAIDGDNDGHLDVPLVKTFPEASGVEIEGPFPKTYIFDRLGQTVDAQNHPVPPPVIVVGNSAGANSIRFDNAGKVVVSPAVKAATTK